MTSAYTPSGNPLNLTRAIAAQVRAEFILIQQGFALFPTYEYAQNYAADSGAANAYVVTLSPVPASYTTGMTVIFKATNANTTASTLNVNSLGAKSITRQDGSALVANDIYAGAMVRVSYDGTSFQLDQNALSSATAAAASAAAAASSASSASTSASNASTSATNASTSATLSSDWATKITGVVASSEYSSKAYAIGGTGVTGAAGAAKEWAVLTSGAVDGGTGYSAKQWATKATTTVDGTYYSAYQYALNAATSAGLAASVFPSVAAGGTVDAITATYSPAITLADLQKAAFVSAGANTSTTPTFAPNGLTARTIKTKGGAALIAGSIGPAGFVAQLQYNLAGTYWELMNPVTGAAGVTSRKILVSNGTNFVASTETYAVPGTSGNVLTSDGTNWLSSTPTSAPSTARNTVLAMIMFNT